METQDQYVERKKITVHRRPSARRLGQVVGWGGYSVRFVSYGLYNSPDMFVDGVRHTGCRLLESTWGETELHSKLDRLQLPRNLYTYEVVVGLLLGFAPERTRPVVLGYQSVRFRVGWWRRRVKLLPT